MEELIEALERVVGREDAEKVTDIICRFGAHERLYKQTKKAGNKCLDG